MAHYNNLDYTKKPSPANCIDNCLHDYGERSGGVIISRQGTLSGNNGSFVVPLFKVTGAVEIVDAFGLVVSATTLTNLTAAYFTFWDQTISIDITANGAVLSGAPVGTVFLRTGIATDAATVLFADQARLFEPDPTSKKTHQPFTLVSKNGVASYIRFHYTTTDAPINCVIKSYMVYNPKISGKVELAT